VRSSGYDRAKQNFFVTVDVDLTTHSEKVTCGEVGYYQLVIQGSLEGEWMAEI
jgi:hypothetical protein